MNEPLDPELMARLQEIAKREALADLRRRGEPVSDELLGGGRRVVSSGNGRPPVPEPVFSRLRWRLKQRLAGKSGRYYGDGGTIHQGGSLDVEVVDGRVVAVWFRCQLLPFEQHDVGDRRRDEMDGVEPGVLITGVEVREQ